jgi:hypothetical protein
MAKNKEELKESVKTHGDFFGTFIAWLIDYRGFSGRDIAYVIEKMHKYDEEIDDWIESEGDDYF